MPMPFFKKRDIKSWHIALFCQFWFCIREWQMTELSGHWKAETIWVARWQDYLLSRDPEMDKNPQGARHLCQSRGTEPWARHFRNAWSVQFTDGSPASFHGHLLHTRTLMSSALLECTMKKKAVFIHCFVHLSCASRLSCFNELALFTAIPASPFLMLIHCLD